MHELLAIYYSIYSAGHETRIENNASVATIGALAMQLIRSSHRHALTVALLIAMSGSVFAQTNMNEEQRAAAALGESSAHSAANLIAMFTFGAGCHPGEPKLREIYNEHTSFHKSLVAFENWVAQIAIVGTAINQGSNANMRLDVAEAAVKSGCYDIASFEFRYVMQFYTGMAYQAYRERAKIGIDDLREKTNLNVKAPSTQAAPSGDKNSLSAPNIAQLKAGCSPKSATARILASANPNDLAPNWRGETRIGSSWNFRPKRSLVKENVVYLEGEVVSPRGSTVEQDVFILLDEWFCPAASTTDLPPARKK
jgi:hypothetical protein